MNRPYLSGVLTTLATLTLFACAARADDKPQRPGDEFDRLARRLERQAHELRTDLLGTFKGVPSHRQLDERLQEVERQAGFIHRAAERDDRPRRVREVLEKLDDELRFIDRVVDELGREREIDRRAYNRFRDDLRDLRETVHRLRREL